MTASNNPVILIVEPVNEVRNYYQKSLFKYHFEPKMAASGQEALTLLRTLKEGELQILVLDWYLKDVPGFIIAQKVRSEPKFDGVEILVCSDEINKEDEFLLAELDIKYRMSKGESVNTIVDKIKFIRKEQVQVSGSLRKLREFQTALHHGDVKASEELASAPELKKEFHTNPQFAHLVGELQILKKQYQVAVDKLQEHVFAPEKIPAEGQADAPKANILQCLNTTAKALCFQGKFDEALPLYEKLAKRSPKNMQHVVAQGEALLGCDRVDDAKQKFGEVLAADPTNKEALGGMGKVEIVAGNAEAAKKYFEKIDGSFESPSFASFFNNRAVAMVHAGKPQDAIELYKNALKFMTRFKAPVLFNLGMAHLRIGEIEEAADVLQQVLGLAEPEFISRKQILLRLREVGKNGFIEAYKNNPKTGTTEE